MTAVDQMTAIIMAAISCGLNVALRHGPLYVAPSVVVKAGLLLLSLTTSLIKEEYAIYLQMRKFQQGYHFVQHLRPSYCERDGAPGDCIPTVLSLPSPYSQELSP